MMLVWVIALISIMEYGLAVAHGQGVNVPWPHVEAGTV
jgi:hypothetical protein